MAPGVEDVIKIEKGIFRRMKDNNSYSIPSFLMHSPSLTLDSDDISPTKQHFCLS